MPNSAANPSHLALRVTASSTRHTRRQRALTSRLSIKLASTIGDMASDTVRWHGSPSRYARISTPSQDPALQLDALNAAGCYRLFTDTASGKLAERPELDRLLDQLRPGDTLAVWRLDRLGRSLAHLIDLAAILEARSVGFRSLSEGIDTTTPGGRLVFHLFGALAEFEQALISERTQKGLEAARARGRSGGRRRVMTADRLDLARMMYDSKQYPMATIAKTVGASPASIYRALAADKPTLAAAV